MVTCQSPPTSSNHLKYVEYILISSPCGRCQQYFYSVQIISDRQDSPEDWLMRASSRSRPGERKRYIGVRRRGGGGGGGGDAICCKLGSS